ncbi:MAG: DUF2334 domain-containing protein [Bryobacteraceae bacterium]
MRFAIRDDDTSYHTRADELERLWGRISRWAPVSLAVTPFAVESFNLGDIARFHQGSEPMPIAANRELVAWLRQAMGERRVSVMCHGYTHQYVRRPGGALVQEFVWKPAERLSVEARAARHHLEQTLGSSIETFVPPGNGISRQAIEALRPVFSNVLATFPLRRVADFRFEREYLINYARRLFYQLRHGTPNPFGETVAGVRLLPSFCITPKVDWPTLERQFQLCRRLEADFVVAVHYWEMAPRLCQMLDRLLDLAARHNCEFRCCDELFQTRGQARLELRAADA